MAKLKKTLDDYRVELNIALRSIGIEDSMEYIEQYEKLVKSSDPIKYKHFGPFRIQLDIYNACKNIVPYQELSRFEQRITHMINTADPKDLNRIKNNITEQYLDLYRRWSNVTTPEQERFYN